MPVYEYVCPECGNKDNRIVPIAQADTQRCSRCGDILTLLVSRPASFPVGKYGKGNR